MFLAEEKCPWSGPRSRAYGSLEISQKRKNIGLSATVAIGIQVCMYNDSLNFASKWVDNVCKNERITNFGHVLVFASAARISWGTESEFHFGFGPPDSRRWNNRSNYDGVFLLSTSLLWPGHILYTVKGRYSLAAFSVQRLQIVVRNTSILRPRQINSSA